MQRRAVLGFNLLILHPQMAGVRSYAVSLVGHMIRQNRQFDIVLFVPSAAGWLLPALAKAAGGMLPADVAVETVRCNSANKASMLYAENLRLPALLRRRPVDLLISLDYHGPLWAGPPQVVTIHDMRFKDMPRSFSWLQRGLRELVSSPVVDRAALLWTVSQFSQERLLAYYPASAGKVRLVGSGGPEPAASAPASAGRGYFLSVSTFVPHKNHLALLRAFAALPDDWRLIIVGERGPALRDRRFRQLLRRAGARVRIMHDVADDELQELYRHARGYVTASRYEGFGLTVLEAMSHGVPVACSNIAALAEVVGDAALTFDPLRPEEIVASLRRLRDDDRLRERLVRRGFARLRRHAWSAAAERALASCAEHFAREPAVRAPQRTAEPARGPGHALPDAGPAPTRIR